MAAQSAALALENEARQATLCTLYQAQKMDAMGKLVGGIAHDLNNSLHSISGHLQLLKISGIESDRMRHSVERALKGCDCAGELMRSLLAFTGQGRYEVKTVCLKDLVVKTRKLLRVLDDDCIRISFTGSEHDTTVLVDENQVQQALTHLITNAVEAMAEGGNITFNFSRLNVSNPERYNRFAPRGEYVCLAISDSGCGISAQNIQHIFEPFFTSKSLGERVGLGLSMVYGCMQSHHGWIDIDSAAGKGTTICLYFPFTAADSGGAKPAPALRQKIGKNSVMVVDDEEALVELAGIFLRRAGYSVQGFTDPQEAVAWFRSHYADVDLIVLDMRMPVMGGEACFEAFRSVDADVKAVIVSGYTQDEAVQRMLARGALGFYQKPLRYPEFIAAICELKTKEWLDNPH